LLFGGFVIYILMDYKAHDADFLLSLPDHGWSISAASEEYLGKHIVIVPFKYISFANRIY
jgi:hypothetical protein